MTKTQSQSLSAVLQEAIEQDPSGSPIIPFELPGIVVDLADSAANWLAECGETATVCADEATLNACPALAQLSPKLVKRYVLADPSAQMTEGEKNVVSISDEADRQLRLCLVQSEKVSLGVVARPTPDTDSGRCKGWWSAHRPLVSVLFDAVSRRSKPPLPTYESESSDQERQDQFVHALLGRVLQRYHERQRELAHAQIDMNTVLQIVTSLSVQQKTHDILFEFVKRIAENIQTDRCSVVRISEGKREAHVLASHEDASVEDVAIDIGKYPELEATLNTGRRILIADVATDPLTRPFRKELEKAGVHSLLVVPIILFNPNVGSYLLRAARGAGAFADREVAFCEIVAQTAANALEKADMFETIQRANERLEVLAITDPLTGLYNRRFFQARLEEEYERAQRYNTALSCLMIDVDDFKRINDTYGHLQGDEVLKELANRTAESIRRNDIVARYGGEELVVIMPQTKEAGAKAQAQRLWKAISERAFEGLPEEERLTISIGVAVLDSKMTGPEDLVRSADNALIEAKRQGKNRIVVGRPNA